MCTDYGYDPPDFVSRTFPISSRPRRCGECKAPIAPGERYQRVVTKWEGEILTMTDCGLCAAWARAFGDAMRRECDEASWEEGRMWATIAEFCSEHLGYSPRNDTEQRAAGAEGIDHGR